jgi:hypothetical protein
MSFYSGIVLCTNPNKFKLFDTSSSSTSSSTLTSLSSTETSSEHSSTTRRPYYPDTFNPGAIAGVAIGSLVFIFFMSIGAYYIRRQRLYYLPNYHDYRPI